MNQAMTSAMTSTSCAARASGPPVSLPEFNRWLLRAQAGQQFEYHRGFLARDRWPSTSVDDRERRQLGRLADAMLQAAEDALVDLVQRRHGPFDCVYIAIKARTIPRTHRAQPQHLADLPVPAAA